MLRKLSHFLTLGLTLATTLGQGQSDLRIPATDDGLPGTGPLRRYEWFQNLWLEKRQGWAKQVQADQDALVFYGDSITQGWGDIGKAFPGIKCANRGISGDTTRGLLVRLQGDVLSLNPKGVVLLIGTNDLEENAEPPVIASNMKLLIAGLKKHNAKMPIVLCQVFPSSASKARPAEKIIQVNKLYQKVVQGDPQVTVIDTWTLFASDTGDAKKGEFPDLLHPNEKGYAKWAAALHPILATLDFTDTEPDTFALEPDFTSLFNGRDLTGWSYLPTTKKMKTQAANWKKTDPNAPPWPIVEQKAIFDGKTTTPDGRYMAKNGRLIVTTPPEGRKIQQLWTTKDYSGNFTLKLEFRATPNADSGVFLKGKQLQCRDFLLAGPYTELKAFRPLKWNELIVRANGNRATCTVNGEIIEDNFQIPESGPFGLEGDRGQVDYRRLRIKAEN
ncbi:GDSL-type esterase/lipase family protein [bacterium]|jgi:lysophospholipase L1-like esterase|nr:GDSL-type esterase/lipase family protein [Verrucomicrobiales bacterium]MDB4454357.1 GDSL-type esterase/lipase family protein [bacterium]